MAPKTAPGPKYDPIQLQKEIQRLQTEDRGIEGEKFFKIFETTIFQTFVKIC